MPIAIKVSKNINAENENSLTRMHYPLFKRPVFRAANPHILDFRRSRRRELHFGSRALQMLQFLQRCAVIQDRLFDGIIGLVTELLFRARKIAGESGIGIGHGIFFFDELDVRSWISFANCRNNVIAAERNSVADVKKRVSEFVLEHRQYGTFGGIPSIENLRGVRMASRSSLARPSPQRESSAESRFRASL